MSTPVENIQKRVQEVRAKVKTRVDTLKQRVGVGKMGILSSSSNPGGPLRTRIKKFRETRLKATTTPTPPPRIPEALPKTKEPKSFEKDLLTIPITATEKPIKTTNKKLYV